MMSSEKQALREKSRKLTENIALVAAAHNITVQSVITSDRTHECPRCQRVLAVAEVIERYCAHCGDVAPKEVRF
ncbi:hypothetical protein GR248_01760 [Rhizobium leguminosarum]|uniref:hypothetical protein n=1 Tax=Rhizobium leguminosarum TaxID=384 RepID=UPI0013C68482|nr:hypothetical protein [Rhizobium leguminosarum]NEI89534.1 hypothetical protein [Rhizobium leguminosarum]